MFLQDFIGIYGDYVFFLAGTSRARVSQTPPAEFFGWEPPYSDERNGESSGNLNAKRTVI